MSNLIFKQNADRKNPRAMPFDAFSRNVFDDETEDICPSRPAEVLREAVTRQWDAAFDVEKEKGLLQQQIGKKKKADAVESHIGPILDAARKEAESILTAAQAQAAQIVEAAKKHSEEIEASAYQAGFEQGEAAGKQLGEQKIDPVVRNLRAMVESLNSERANFLQAAEQDLVKAAFLIALQLIRREIQQDPSVVLEVVRSAISRTQRATNITVYASPNDFKFLEDHVDLMQGMLGNGGAVNIEPDSSILRGGCRVVSNTGEVDATIDSMIAQLKNRLWEEE